MAPYIPDNGNETPFVMTTQFPEHLPRLSQQPTLASGCHGLPAEVTIGCGGGAFKGPRMAGNGETVQPAFFAVVARHPHNAGPGFYHDASLHVDRHARSGGVVHNFSGRAPARDRNSKIINRAGGPNV